MCILESLILYYLYCNQIVNCIYKFIANINTYEQYLINDEIRRILQLNVEERTDIEIKIVSQENIIR